MRALPVVLGLLGLAGCQYVWNLDEFPGPVHGGQIRNDPNGDLDGDGIPNGMDGCPNLPNTLPGGNSDKDGDGVPDLCDPNPETNGDCIALFDDFGDPTLSPHWQFDGNPVVVVHNDPTQGKLPYAQFDATSEEVIYLDKQLDLDAVSVWAYAQAGDNPAAGRYAFQVFVDLTRSPKANGEACGVESSNGTGFVEHLMTTEGVDTAITSGTPVADQPGTDSLRVGAGNTFVLEWGTADAGMTCLASTNSDLQPGHGVAAPVPPSGTFALRGRHVGMFILGVVGYGHNCAAN